VLVDRQEGVWTHPPACGGRERHHHAGYLLERWRRIREE